MTAAEKTLSEVLDAFDFGAPVVGALRYGKGHVNDTFCVHTQPQDDSCSTFILQRMSGAAFRHPDLLMHNIVQVTEYLRRKVEDAGGDPSREAMRILRPKNGEEYYTDSEGGAWRVVPFIRDTCCYESAETPELFAASGRAFGKFQRLMDGYPAETLYETIPHFHDTADRLRLLKRAVAADRRNRAGQCAREIAFAYARERDCSRAVKALRAGVLPLRVIHNDTKLDNVLIDRKTGEGICVIDLDTVMPGSSIYDFGDSIRYGANHNAEDERDLRRVNLDLNLFAVYTRAFLEGTGDVLTDTEIAWLPWGARLMTLECGMRFLTDFLEGDTYFRTTRPGQNLDRARVQFKLLTDMERHWADMQAIVKEYIHTEQPEETGDAERSGHGETPVRPRVTSRTA